MSRQKVVETVTTHSVKTAGGSVTETKTTTLEELQTIEGIVTSCMETTCTVMTPAKENEGIERK